MKKTDIITLEIVNALKRLENPDQIKEVIENLKENEVCFNCFELTPRHKCYCNLIDTEHF